MSVNSTSSLAARLHSLGTLPAIQDVRLGLAALAPQSLFLVSIVLSAFLWAVAAPRLLYPYYSNNHDEPVYVLQARTLLDGKLYLPTDDLSPFFKPWLTSIEGNRMIFKYTPVHAGVLALGQLLFGSMRSALAIVAGLNVVLFYRFALEMRLRRNVAAWSALLLLFSPLFLIQSATFLPYTTALLFHLLFGILFLRGCRLNSRPLLLLSGVVLGIDAFARPYDALLVALAFGIHLLIARRQQPREILTIGLWTAAGFAPLLGVILAYNRLVTGNAFAFPFSILDPLDALGFGPRRMFPGNVPIIYDAEAAFASLTRNLLLLNFWSPGGPILLGCVVLRLALVKIRWAEKLLVALLVLFPVGYFLFWGTYNIAYLWKGGDYLGPFYYLPMLVPTIILGLQGLRLIHRQNAAISAGLAIAMVCLNVSLLARHFLDNQAFTYKSTQIYRPIVESNLDNALVLVPPAYGPVLLHPFPFFENTPALNGPVVYALNLGSQNFKLMDAYPGRAVYRFDYFGLYTEEPYNLAESGLTPIQRVQLPSLRQRLRIENPGDAPYVLTYIWNGTQKETYLLDTASRRGSAYEIEWIVTPGQVWLEGDYEQKLSSIDQLTASDYLAVAVSFGHSPDDVGQAIYERRFWFRLTDDHQLELALPAEEWHSAQFPNTPFIQSDLGPVLADR